MGLRISASVGERVYPQVAQILVSSLVNCRTIGKLLVGMPTMRQRRPNNFKTPLEQQKIILLGHCWGIVGWYTNYKFKGTRDVKNENFLFLFFRFFIHV